MPLATGKVHSLADVMRSNALPVEAVKAGQMVENITDMVKWRKMVNDMDWYGEWIV